MISSATIAVLSAASLFAASLVIATPVAASPQTPMDALPPGMTDLGAIDPTESSGATGVSGNIVIGWTFIEAQAWLPFVYDLSAASPSMRAVRDLGSGFTLPSGISGSTVVGSSGTDVWVEPADGDGSSSYDLTYAFVFDASEAQPTMHSLGTLPNETISMATAISGHLVVGAAMTPTMADNGLPRSRAFAVDLDTTTRAMRDLGTLGGPSAMAEAVSGDVVVGHSTDIDNNSHAFAIDVSAADSLMSDLGTLGGTESDAVAVDGTIVVGHSTTASGSVHAFAYDLAASSPSMVDLGTLGGSFSSAYAVDAGVVIGHSTLADGSGRAFAYDLGAPTPTMRDLGTLGGNGSNATAVSGSVVVGHATTASGTVHAFAYDLAESPPAMHDLGSIYGNSDALAIDGDVVVGRSDIPDDRGRAVVWDLRAILPIDSDGDGWPDAIDDRPLTPDILGNGSFESGDQTLPPWTFRHDITGSFVVDQSTSAIGDASVRVNIGATSTSSPWLVQLREEGVALQAGTTYTVSYWAKASAPREIDLRIQSSASPFQTLASKRVSLTTTWQRFALTTTASVGVADAFVGFNLAQQTGDVWLDGVSMTAGNLVVNGGFETGGSTMSPWRLRNELGAVLTRDTAVKATGIASARIEVTTVGSAHLVQWRAAIAPLTAGHTYLVSFSVRASTDRTVNARVQGANPPYTTVASRTITATPRWTRISFEWTPTKNVPDPFFGFNLGQAAGTVWLDNVALVDLT